MQHIQLVGQQKSNTYSCLISMWYLKLIHSTILIINQCDTLTERKVQWIM